MRNLEKLKEKILSQNPTEEQIEAIFSNELEFLLRASPGSGKTWTSCRRFIWRGANWNYSVGGLALLSYTNAAIREFQSATIKVGRRELLSDPNYVGTFDSFIERFIITPFGHLLTGAAKRPRLFIAPRPGDRNNSKLKTTINLTGGKTKPVYAWDILPFREEKCTKYGNRNKSGILREVENGKKVAFSLLKLGYYTHEQRIYLAFEILEHYPHITKCLARRFPEIIVDEAQDTNVWLIKILILLRENRTKVTLIGDPDQCIYEFCMAEATALYKLKEYWKIPEKTLSKSFRSNNPISEAVRNISGNNQFSGCGPNNNEFHRPFIIRLPGSDFGFGVGAFKILLDYANIPLSQSAVLCRAHKQLESIKGNVNFNKLKGTTKKLAEAAFIRDTLRDYRKVNQIVEKAIREIIKNQNFWQAIDDEPESNHTFCFKLELWKFIKSPHGLPSINRNGDEWIEELKINLESFIASLGITDVPKLGTMIKRTGLKSVELATPLFQAKTIFSEIRQETIHKVKGESIDGVLLIGSPGFFDKVVKSTKAKDNIEERRLAYVAMTRARHTLLVGLPASHYDKYHSDWEKWGFGIFKYDRDQIS